jgi:hypothetical protein
LLFLFYATDTKSWQLDGCGNSGPLNKAQMALAEITAIISAKGDGMIVGGVGKQDQSAGLAGVKVEADGKSARYAATTNEKGEFHMRVPPGQYTMTPVEKGFVFQKDDFSYEDPRRIRIESGACAQVQFDRAKDPPGR